MAIVLGATALLGGASALYFRSTMHPNDEEVVEARVFAPPSSWFEATTLVAEAIRLLSRELRAWRPDDLTLGVNRLGKRELTVELARELAESGASRVSSADGNLLRDLDNLLAFCFAVAHGRTVSRVAELAGIEESAVLASQLYALTLRPAYSLIRDEASRSLVLVLRGTHSLRDTLTCLTAATQPHHALPETLGLPRDSPPVLGYAHSGFLTAARWLLAQTSAAIQTEVEAHPGFSLTITGHSMGAGAAVLLTMMLRERPSTAHATCVAFACPAVLTRELAEICTPFVTSVLTGCDIVPTASAGAVTCLREEMRAARRQAFAERAPAALVDRAALARLVGAGWRFVGRPGQQQQAAGAKYATAEGQVEDVTEQVGASSSNTTPMQRATYVQSWLTQGAASLACRCWAMPGGQLGTFDPLDSTGAGTTSSGQTEEVSLVPPAVDSTGAADWRGRSQDSAEVLVRDGERLAAGLRGARRQQVDVQWSFRDGGGGGRDAIPQSFAADTSAAETDWDPDADVEIDVDGSGLGGAALRRILTADDDMLGEVDLDKVELFEQSGSEDGDMDDEDDLAGEGSPGPWARGVSIKGGSILLQPDRPVGLAGDSAGGADGDAKRRFLNARRKSLRARRQVPPPGTAASGDESDVPALPSSKIGGSASAASVLSSLDCSSAEDMLFAGPLADALKGAAGDGAGPAEAESPATGRGRTWKVRPKVLFPAGRIIHTVWDSSAPADPPPAAAAAAAAGREERRGGESATTSGRAGPSAFPRAAAAGASPSRFPDGAAAFAAAFGFAANGSWVGHGSAAAALSSRSTSGAAPTAGDAGGGAAASPSGRQSAAAGSSDLPDGTGSPSPSGQPSGQPIHRSSSAAVALERAPARKRHVRMEPLVRLERLERRHKPPWRLPGSSGHWVMYDHVPHSRYGKLLLSKRMVLDHYIPTQADALWGVMAELGVDV